MKTLGDKVNVGEIVVGVCSGCNTEGELRYEGIQKNPVRKTKWDAYSCTRCKTTRAYNIRGIQNG